MEALLNRMYGEKQTIGKMYCMKDNSVMQMFDSLELPWKDNNVNISCIPEGVYNVKKRYSEKYKWHYHVTNVKDRSWILIHKGNFYTDIRGCILLGKELADINGDGLMDVTHSGNAIDEFESIMPDKFQLKITQNNA